MRAWLWLGATSLAALLEGSTGWFHDTTGHAVLDLVLALALSAGVWCGPRTGLVCGILGGLIVGAPGNVGVQTALIYGLSGGLAGLLPGQRGVRSVFTIACLGAATTLWLSFLCGSWFTVVPLAVHNLEAVALVLLAARLVDRPAAV